MKKHFQGENAPMSIWAPVRTSAPGRGGIAGNPSDMYGGSMLSCATKARAECAISPANALALSVGGEAAVIANGDDLAMHGDRLDVARAALAAFGIDPLRDHFDLEASTAIPMQAGLAGSTALVCAIVAALQASSGSMQHAHHLVETVRDVEMNHLGVLCGFQDATMTVFGGLRFIDVRNREQLRQGVDEPYVVAERLTAPAFPFILAHTGVKHHSGTVHTSLRDRWLEGEPAVVAGYARIQRIAQMGKRALLDADWERLAALMAENHAIQRDLGGSGDSNERLIRAALDAGALAAKLAGAGGGGTIIALTHEPERIGKALMDAGADTLIELDPEAAGLVVEHQENQA
ncbi:MAG TPA: hypothetical protein VGM51_07440 [Armatimonadota bacterium]|jgi:galactokinase/mevalonate kinase-like predicted kinase